MVLGLAARIAGVALVRAALAAEPADGPTDPAPPSPVAAPAEPPIPPPPPLPMAECLDTARDEGQAGFYAARDARVVRAFACKGDDAQRLEALKLLADTAERTGDWTHLESVRVWPKAPGPACACDALAWHVALTLIGQNRRSAAPAWLDSVGPGSPAWPDAERVRARLAGIRSDGAIPTLTAITAATVPANPHARALHDRATLDVARQRCAPATYPDAAALFGALPKTGPHAADVATAWAWCAARTGHTDDLTTQLAALDKAEHAGAWVPSLPLLHALAVTGDTAARHHALEAARATSTPVWGMLAATAAAVAGSKAGPEVWERVLDPRAGLPPGLVARLNTNEVVTGFEGRFAELDREAARAQDPDVRRDLAAEREAASARAAFAVARLLDSYAFEVGWLRDVADRLLYEMDTPADHPGKQAIEALTTQEIEGLRAFSQRDELRDQRGEITFRLAELEADRVPTETTIATLRAALGSPPAYYRRAARPLALALIDAGRPAEAEAALGAVATAPPRNPEEWQAQALLGELAFARQDFAAADAAYTVATKAPDRALALYATYRRAWCAWALGLPKDAAARIAEVLADPATPPDLRQHAQAEQALLTTCRKGLKCPK